MIQQTDIDFLLRQGAAGAAEGGGRELEAQGWRAWYAEIFGQSFVDVLARHHIEAVEWHWNARHALIKGEKPDYLAYFSIWARGNMKTTIARYMSICDACLSISAGIGGYALVVGGTKRKVKGSASTIESLLHSPKVAAYYPSLSKVKRNEQGASKGWTADFINTEGGYVFHFIGLDEGVAGANFDNIRPTFIIPDDIDDREDSPVISEGRFQTFTRAVLPTRQANTLVFFAQNLISRYSVMYRIWKQQERVLTNRLFTEPIPAVLNLTTKTETVGGIVKDIVVSGTPTWEKGWDTARIQDEIDTYGLDAFLRECQHEVEQSKQGVIIHTYDDDIHPISYSQFSVAYGARDAWKEWYKVPFNDWSRTKTERHANVAGYLAVSSQNTPLPGMTFCVPLSFRQNAMPEDVAARLLDILTPYATKNGVTWQDLIRDELLRLNSSAHTGNFQDRIEYERSHLKRIIPAYSAPVLERYNVKAGAMSHSEDTIRAIFNGMFGFSFLPANPKKLDAVEDINRAMKVDYSMPHPIVLNKKGYTRFFVLCADDTSKEPVIINGVKVFPPKPYPDALRPDALMDDDLFRYQLRNWRMREAVISATGEIVDEPLKLNDDFPQSLQMVYFKRLLSEIPLTEPEQIEKVIADTNPELAISAMIKNSPYKKGFTWQQEIARKEAETVAARKLGIERRAPEWLEGDNDFEEKWESEGGY